MEGQNPAEEALKQLDAMQLPDTPDVQRHREALLGAVRLVTEYPQHFEQLEAEHNFAKQLENRNGILQSAGLTTDINGNQIAYPSYEQERVRLLERPQLLTKLNQGFVRMQPVPIGAPLSAYFTALEDALRQYAKEGRLRAANGTALTLNDREPLWKWDAYNDADWNGTLVYEPTQFSAEDHGGKTKAQLIEDRGPMQLLLTENLRDIPREGRGQTIGGRPQIEAGKRARQYLAMLGNGAYAQETPYTLEAELAHMLTHLHETQGEVIDDYQSGSAAYCPGGLLPAHGNVPRVHFDRDDGQLVVGGDISGNDRPYDRVRCSVSVP